MSGVIAGPSRRSCNTWHSRRFQLEEASAAAKVKNGVKENNRREQMHQSILGDGVAKTVIFDSDVPPLKSVCVCMWGGYLDIYVCAAKYAHMIIPARSLARSEK